MRKTEGASYTTIWDTTAIQKESELGRCTHATNLLGLCRPNVVAWEEREEPRTLRMSLRSGTRAATRAYFAYARVPLFCGKSGTFGTSTLHPCHECVLLCTGSAYSATIRELSGTSTLHPCHECAPFMHGFRLFCNDSRTLGNLDAAPMPQCAPFMHGFRFSVATWKRSELRRCTHATSRLCL